MLRLVAFANDSENVLLENSFNTIKNRDSLEIVTDDEEKDALYKKTIEALTASIATFSFINLFRLQLSRGKFYIAQCLFDFGHPSRKSGSSPVRVYKFQAFAVADITIDLGRSLLRRETKLDKLMDLFYGNDIDFEGTEKFNDKYYLLSDHREEIHKAFDKDFINVLGKYDNLILVTKGYEMFIGFESDMIEDHCRQLEDVLSHFKFLAE